MNKFGNNRSAWQRKFAAILFRLLEVFRHLPKRLQRLMRHLLAGVRGTSVAGQIYGETLPLRVSWWLVESLILLLELTGIGEFYEIGNELVKRRARPLSEREMKLAQSVFGSALRNYERIRIDETAGITSRQGRFCYVSFYWINSWGSISDKTLIHELVHVWQYEQMGAVYIPRALRAQRTSQGYDYGGLDHLTQALEVGKTIHDFNLEQQAEIVADFFLLRQGFAPQWGNARKADLPVYQTFIDQLQKGLARSI